MFNFVLKSCNFYCPTLFKKNDNYTKTWTDEKFVLRMKEFRKKYKSRFSAMYNSIQVSNELQRTLFDSNLDLIAKKFLKKYKTKSINVKKNSALTTYCGIFHKSGINTSNQVRFTIVVRYNNQFSKDFLYYRNLIKSS